jgi:two-component system, NarL family, sensor histidine kinase BarA
MQTDPFIKSNFRILIVEDNEINIELLVHHLREIAITDLAYTGETAIAQAFQIKYDLILLDICLGSGLDGFEVQKEIKSHGVNKDTPIIAVTGSTSQFDQGDFLVNGFQGCLSKPFTKQELMEVIQSVII